MSAESKPLANLAGPQAAASTGPPEPAMRPRLESVDLLRGTIMALMALDHTRGAFSNAPYDPLDLTQTFPALFLTRWITHYCAPVFFFLAGTGAFLWKSRGRETGEVSRFLLTRGLWLIVLELTYLNCLGWSFKFSFDLILCVVMWAIGWSMVALAALVWLPLWAVALVGLGMIGLHNMLDAITPESMGAMSGLWRVLHAGREFKVGGITFNVIYPLIPWIGVMAAGYSFGWIILREPAARRKWLLGLGGALTLGFVLLRWSNVYGDTKAWTTQKDTLSTIFSFIDCRKYPPSLCYLLMTLGPALLLLAFFDRKTPLFARPLLIFGRVPLFYFLLHLPLIHGLAIVVNFVRTGAWPGGGRLAAGPPYAQFGLPGVYVFWMVILVLMYPPCRWFAGLKRRSSAGWLSYL